jgi:predicted Rdx family selenoprotein
VAAELRREFGIESKLIKGEGGIFDVKLNGRLLYSKSTTFSFPEPGEIPKLIRAG